MLRYILSVVVIFASVWCAPNQTIAGGDLTLFYPVNSPWLNTVDTLVVSWTSRWPLVNGSAWCKVDNATNQWRYKNFGQWDKTGTFIIPNINQYFKAYQYPTTCHFNLRNQNNASEGGNTGQFILTSSPKSASTASAQLSATVSGSVATASSASPTSDNSTITSPSTPDATGTGSSEQSNDSGSLSNGAKIAIGVVIPVAVIAGAVVAFFIWSRRRKSRRTTNRHELADTNVEHKSPWSDTTTLDHGSEMNSSQKPSELGDGGVRTELHGASEISTGRNATRSAGIHEMP